MGIADHFDKMRSSTCSCTEARFAGVSRVDDATPWARKRRHIANKKKRGEVISTVRVVEVVDLGWMKKTTNPEIEGRKKTLLPR